MHALKMAVFDFDGTLVDSVPAIARGIQLANEKIGIAPVSYDTAKSIIGLGFKDIIPIVAPDLPESEYGRYKDIYVSYFLQSDPSLKLFPGVLKLLRDLKDSDVNTAIATGKSRKGLSRIVNRMDIWNYFDDSITADEALPKPDPLMLRTLMERNGLRADEVVMIGDTEHDIKFGKAAGVRTVAVTWGAAPRARLEAYAPDAIVSTMEELKIKLDEFA